ncbi:MAG: hypothetical protein J6T67_10415 [Paludibacteraceae bacterium]|nr:hypothetical protein [Paludibacteraceae bacterium]
MTIKIRELTIKAQVVKRDVPVVSSVRPVPVKERPEFDNPFLQDPYDKLKRRRER